MASTSDAASGSASTTVTAASTVSSYTTHIYWGSKGLTFLLSIRKYSWGLFSLRFSCLVQRVLIICFPGIILAHLSYDVLVVLLGFDTGYLLGFTLIFVRIITWGSGRSLSSLPNLWLTGSCSDYFFNGSSWPGWSYVGLVLFRRSSYGLIVDNVELSVKIWCIM